MKKIIILLVAMFTGFISEQANAEKYVIFISGYGGNVWTSSNTPAEWDGTVVPEGNVLILDDVLRNFPQVLLSSTSSLTSTINFEALLSSFLESLIKGEMIELFGEDRNVEIVLVGHSVGGYVARLLEHVINSWNFPSQIATIDVVGVITIATPHQGVRVAGVSVGAENGFINVLPTMQEYRDKLTVPYNTAQSGIVGNWVSSGSFILTGVDAMTEIEDAFDLLDDQIEFLEDQQFIGFDVVVGGVKLGHLYLKEIISPGKVFPNLLNSIQPSAQIRSIYGVEKYPIPVRIADEVVGDGNEKATADNYSAFRRYYKAEEDYWETLYKISATRAKLPWCIFGCRKKANRAKDAAKRKENLWKDGRHAIENVDNTWGTIIDSYFTEARYITYQRYVGCDNQPEDEIGPGSIFDEPRPIDCIDNGWETVTELVYVHAAQKNDAVTAPQYGVWKNSDMQNYSATQSKGNFFYGDTGNKGGYNHMEMRRLKYAYNDPANGIVKNERAEPMDQAERWLLRDVLVD